MLGIFFVCFVPVSLPLERDGGISCQHISRHRQPNQPLCNIKDIEPDPQQFSLLKGMDILVIHADARQFLLGKYNAKKVDGYHASAKRYDMIVNDFHFGLLTQEY